jgi:multisubunit Na+/H+ antiporter MnhC subunit
VNIAWTIVVIIVVGWSLISILVALAFGGMAKGRDETTVPLLDHPLAPGQTAPPLPDEGVRTAV